VDYGGGVYQLNNAPNVKIGILANSVKASYRVNQVFLMGVNNA